MSDYDNETGEIFNLDSSKLGFANLPIKDNEGFVRGKLTEISYKTFISKEKRTKKSLEDDKTYNAFVFNFEIESTGDKPIKMNIRTGTLISPEKSHIKAKGRGKTKEQPEYNKLTELLLRLKIATIEEISSFDNKKTDEILKRMREANSNHIFIKSKLQIQEDGEFETLNPRTIEKINSFEFKNSQNN